MTASRTGVISGVRVTHRNGTVDEIGAAGSGDQRTDVSGLLSNGGVEEAFVLRTCNRAEAYVVSDDAVDGRAALEAFVADVPDVVVVETDHEESLRHLMEVAAGVESMVLGEDRILGQVREAYEDARGAGGIGPVLEDAVTKAIHVGERVRTETAINEGTVSLASAAVDILDDAVDLGDATGLVVGAGDIGTTAARAMADHGVERLVVANRTVHNAREVTEVVDAEAEAVGLDDLPAALVAADAVVTATGSADPVIDVATLDDAGRTVVVDMGQPRDVAAAAAALEAVEVYDLDALEAVTEATRERRREAADRAREIVDREFDLLIEQYKRKRADEVVATMHEGAQAIKARELETAFSKLESSGDLTDEQREVVEALADSLVNKLLAAPTKSLRDAAAEDDWETISTAIQLFDPGFESGPPSFVVDGEGESRAAASSAEDEN